MGHGPWAMGHGPWAMGHGPWAMGILQRSIVLVEVEVPPERNTQEPSTAL